jgi:heme/copper-type cytochrome/quinol oxidase subunit 2
LEQLFVPGWPPADEEMAMLRESVMLAMLAMLAIAAVLIVLFVPRVWGSRNEDGDGGNSTGGPGM